MTPDVATIADRAASLWERLANPPEDGEATGSLSAAAERRFDRWRAVVARGDISAFESRLAWDGLGLAQARAAVAADEPMPATEWAEVLEDLLRSVAQFRRQPPAQAPGHFDRERPFEDVLRPLVYAARCRLCRRLGDVGADDACLPLPLLADSAYLALEAGLLDRLSRLCVRCLFAEFSASRPAGHGLLTSLVGNAGQAGKAHYQAFVAGLLADNLMPLFAKYPVLARLVATVSEHWVAYCAEFHAHLGADLPAIEQCFGDLSPQSLGKVAELRLSLSDAHHGGRSVIGVSFAGGLKLAYKPKPLGVEAAFQRLVRWCGELDPELDLKDVRILDRGSHGWMEWLDHLPCRDEQEVDQFYRRSGMLLGLLHALRCTDCHRENLVAHGGQPVLIDLETLMVPDMESFSSTADAIPNASFWYSVLRTGMLPQWETRADGAGACDVSGLGSVGSQMAPAELPQWRQINTDDMHRWHGPMALPPQHNAPILAGRTLSPGDHVDALVAGFSRMYRLLLSQRSRLLAADGLLSAFRGQTIRYVFRHTEQYGRILVHSLAPEHLGHGCDRSIELDHLSRGFVVETEAARSWAIQRAEVAALEGLDIPKFEVLADATALQCHGRPVASDFFERSGYSRVVTHIESLSEDDLALQVRIIRAAFMARHAGPAASHGEQATGETAQVSAVDAGVDSARRRQVFLDRAMAIADDIAARAFANPDGSVGWISLAHLSRAGRYQLQPLGEGLYGGRCGVALFLAACDQVQGRQDYRPLVRRALQPIRAWLRGEAGPDTFLRVHGIGGAEGAGGAIYALASIGQWWREPELIEEAGLLARALSPTVIAADRCFDVIQGSAGALLGLLKLYRLRPDTEILRVMERCADWLCRNQLAEGEHVGAWTTMADTRPLAGFSHGASGIACALSHLYGVTEAPGLLTSVRAALAFERSAFVAEAGNWIDYRRQEPGRPASFSSGWCHGAPGIALARLGMRPTLRDAALADDLKVALGTCALPRGHTVDHVCCGSFGRFEIMLQAAAVLGRNDLAEQAEQQAWDILCRPGGFRIPPSDVPDAGNPGFFDGLAGIGYALLRLAAPGELPCVLAWE